MQRSERKESPCMTCRRVRNPQDCENKMCRQWQSWWVNRWNAIRAEMGVDRQNSDCKKGGIQ